MRSWSDIRNILLTSFLCNPDTSTLLSTYQNGLPAGWEESSSHNGASCSDSLNGWLRPVTLNKYRMPHFYASFLAARNRPMTADYPSEFGMPIFTRPGCLWGATNAPWALLVTLSNNPSPFPLLTLRETKGFVLTMAFSLFSPMPPWSLPTKLDPLPLDYYPNHTSS